MRNIYTEFRRLAATTPFGTIIQFYSVRTDIASFIFVWIFLFLLTPGLRALGAMEQPTDLSPFR